MCALHERSIVRLLLDVGHGNRSPLTQVWGLVVSYTTARWALPGHTKPSSLRLHRPTAARSFAKLGVPGLETYSAVSSSLIRATEEQTHRIPANRTSMPTTPMFAVIHLAWRNLRARRVDEVGMTLELVGDGV